MTQKELLNNTTILFDDIEEYKPKMCIVKDREESGLYHLKESRDLTEQEIFRIFFGLAKYMETKGIYGIAHSKERIKFEITNKEDSNNE